MKKIVTIAAVSLILFSCSREQQKSYLKTGNEVESYFEKIKDDSVKLEAFLKNMPKGGDIHHHTGGSVSAESLIEMALKDSLYINPVTYQLYSDKNGTVQQKESSAVLINILLAENPAERDSIIDNWSIRDYKKRGRNGHDLFFSTFDKFGPAMEGNTAGLLSGLCSKAADENISYLETMVDINSVMDSLWRLSSRAEWNDEGNFEDELADLYNYFEKNNIKGLAEINSDSLDNLYNSINKHGLEVKFQGYGLRTLRSIPVVFGWLLLSFETAGINENVVGVNFVAPEDNSAALTDYMKHMYMFEFLSRKYPSVNISLHAGELALGKGDAGEGDLKFHIMQALKTGKAKRIGHGVDITSEDNYKSILKFMKDSSRAVEINLRSNEVILETNKDNHPVSLYLDYGVPVCISTDDEGVLRTNMTEQYILLTRYIPDITYSQIKNVVYNSIVYSFMDEDEKGKVLQNLDERFEAFEQKVTSY